MIRVGVAGLRRGAGFVTLFDAHAEAEVVALCDTDSTVLARAAERWPHARPCATFEDLLEAGLDLVVVATPVPDHARQAIAALDAHVHVLSEVPAATSMAECEHLIAAVERSGRFYMMAENVCYFPAIQTLKSLVDGGRLGRIVYAESDYWHNVRPPTVPGMARPWRYTLAPITYCTHTIGPLCYALGDRFVEVTAYGSGPQLDPAAPSDDLQVGLFRTARGALAKVSCCFALRRDYLLYFSVLGTGGAFETARATWDKPKLTLADLPNMQDVIPLPLSLTEHPGAPPEARAGGHGTSEYYLVRDVMAALVAGSPPPFDIYDAVAYTVPGLCAAQSIAEHRTVTIPTFKG